jgi:outer membrane protein assembly factor BamB
MKALVLVATLAALQGQTATALPDATWPAYQYRSDHNAVFSEPQWNFSWKADIGAKNNGGLAIVGGKLFVTSFDHSVRAFDARSGSQLWSQSFDDIVMSTPLVVRGLVFAGTGAGTGVSDDGVRFVAGRPEGNEIVALDAATGAVAWRYHTAGQNMPSGVIADAQTQPRLVFLNGDEHVRALDATSGRLIWEREAPGNVTMSSLALDSGRVYGVAFASFVYMLKALAANDQVKLAHLSWTWALRPDDGDFLMTTPYGSGDCPVTVAAGTVFVEGQQFESVSWIDGPAGWPGGPTHYPDFARTTLSNEVDALDAETGRLLWRYKGTPGLGTVAGTNVEAIAGLYVEGTFYDALPYSREFAAFDAKSGHVRWKIRTPDPIKMSAVEKDGRLYAGDNGGHFYVVRASDGAIEQTIKFSDPFGFSPPVIVGETLFVTNGRTLYALRLADLDSGKLAP